MSAIFIIDRNECTAKIYLNGVMCEAFHLSDYVIEGEKFLEDFTVNNHVIIGGKDKNGYSAIRNLRIYEVALATNEILNNFISNETNKEKQKELVNFQKGNDLPTLTIYGDFSGLGKDDKKPCDIVYVSPDTNKYGESFTLSGKYSQLQYQGTSSMQYPIKNYRINPRDKDGKKKINPFNGGKPESRFTLKADFMTSNHAHNTGMAKFISDKLYNYNNNDEKTMNPMRWHLLQNGEDVNSVRETINGFPCRLILVNDGESALNEGQAEPTPGNTKDMGIFNFNNDKDNLNTMGMDTDIFPNCISYEVTANSDTSAGAFVPYTPSGYSMTYWINGSGTSYKYSSPLIPISFLKDTLELTGVQCVVNNGGFRYTQLDSSMNQLGQKTINGGSLEIDFIEGVAFIRVETQQLECDMTMNNIPIIFTTERTTQNVEETPTALDNELEYLQNSFELRYPDEDDVGKDYGYLGMPVNAYHFRTAIFGGAKVTSNIPVSFFNADELILEDTDFSNGNINIYVDDVRQQVGAWQLANEPYTINISNAEKIKFEPYGNTNWTYLQLNGVKYFADNIHDPYDNKLYEPHIKEQFSQDYGLKRVIDWVGNCTDEEFVRDFDKYFNKHYTLRYYLLVVLIGAVDNLGKNLMLDTWDGQIWYPRFYDIDTILSYDNSGAIKFDVDIEMEQGYWNTSASRLWTKIRDYMHDELVEVYKQMRGNGVTYENIMYYMYDEQIAKIPQTYYNKDFDIKYAPYADEYLGKAHGDGYQHMKRWLKNRFIFCDTLFDYAPSYENDKLTIRANTLDLMSLEIETYTPVYQHISFYNGQMSKEKVDGKTSTIFEGTAQTATDQEVLIYGGSNIKKISGLSSMNPDSMLIGNATRLTELIATDCPLLTEINSDKANLLPNVYLNKVDLSGCPLLGGMLKISNSQLLQNLNMKGTAITGVQLPSSIRNLEVLRLPNTLNSLTLNDAPLLHTLEFDNGINLQSISLKNCNRLDNCINFDLTQTPTVVLDNSYNTEELYMSEITNLTLKNMSTLKRVIFTPNSEYSEFDINNVINGKNYKITTFNNPMMTDFITTAPHRLSYNGSDVEWVDKEVGKVEVVYEGNLLEGASELKEGCYVSQGDGTIGLTVSVKALEDYIPVIAEETYTFKETSSYDLKIQIVFYKEDKTYTLVEGESYIKDKPLPYTFTVPKGYSYLRFHVANSSNSATSTPDLGISNLTLIGKYITLESQIIQIKDYGDITPNTAFTANTLDLADTQFQNVKFLCTTDVYNLKVPTTLKNFYCDSAMDIDTDVIEDASYEVIHEELIEPYTTNYEGEVLKYTDVVYDMLANWDTLPNGQSPTPSVGSTANDLINTTVENLKTTDYIRVVPGTVVTWKIEGDLSDDKFAEYDKDKKFIKSVGNANSNINGNPTRTSVTLSEETHYIRLSVKRCGTYINKIELSYKEAKTPNIIPSSASGSLIFNMYSNNTTQPTSISPYMWDLTGLKLNDFYTYGMNNWVKGGKVEEYIVDKVKINDNTYVTCRLNVSSFNGSIINTGNNDMQVEFYSPSYISSHVLVKNEEITIPSNATQLIFIFSSSEGSVSANGYTITLGTLTTNNTTTYNLETFKQEISKSITMPQRMSGYSVRLVNADITPDEYPTMLYPKLIDTTLPITGKLDYTKYNGSSLAWAYAYTTGDVDIQPVDSRSQGQITNDYNKLYGTDYVDIVDVWVYKDTDVSKLSVNENITKAYIELTNANYTTRIDEVLQWYPNCTDIYLFEDGSVTSLENMFNNNNTTYKKQIVNVTFIDGYFENLININFMFRDCKLQNVYNIPQSVISMVNTFEACRTISTVILPPNVQNLQATFVWASGLTHINNIPSSATNISSMFEGATSFNQQLDLSNLKIANDKLVKTFLNCSSLTTSPILPSNYTGSMQSCFQNCKALTEAPIIPDGVTNMQDTFKGCTSITDWSNMLDFQFDNVTNLTSAFSNTQVSTSIFENKTMITSRVNIRYLFQYYQGTEFIAPENFTFGSTQNNEVEFHSVWGEGNASTIDLSNLKFVENTVVNFYNAFFGGYSGNDKLQRIIFPECNLKGANMAFQGNRALTYIDMSKADASTCTDWGNPFNQYNTALTTFKPPKNISTNLDLSPCTALEEEWVHAVVDNLAEVESATLTLNETLGSYLTPDEVFSANQKGWTIVGANSDFTIVNASVDASTLTIDESVLSCFIELTSDNYKSRVDEVLAYYPNCTDIYFFEDGNMNNLSELFIKNTTSRNQIEHITFMEGYFDKVTSMRDCIRVMPNLLTITNLPKNLTQMNQAFFGCDKLIALNAEIPDTVITLSGAFRACCALNQQIDLSNVALTDGNGLVNAFYECNALTIPPILPTNYKGNMQGTFANCTSLTTPPTIPSSVTDMQSCFNGCTSLTQAPKIPSSCTNANYCFNGCNSLINGAEIESTSLKMTSMYSNCRAMKTVILPLNAMVEYQDTLAYCNSLTDIVWIGERTTNFNFSYIGKNDISQADIQELVPEHLADLTASGTTATLTLGEYASYLSIGEILSAQAKGWTIEGNFSMDYTMVNASTDLSAIEVNSDITTVIIELTNDNYKTRISEVYAKYPSMTDILFTEDGTVTTLADMCNNSNNNTARSKIKKIEFLEGYFQNLTSLSYSFYQCSSLTDVSNIPSSVTNMYRTFYYCYDLENVSDLPDGVTNVNYTFYRCESLMTAPKLGKSTTVLDYTFYGCEYLETVPEFPPNITKLTGTFSGCSKLTSVPDIPNSVTDMSNCFYNCSRLVVAPNIPTSVHTLSSTFQGCSSLKTPPSIIPKSVMNASSCFNGCSSLVTPPEFEHVDGTGLYTGRMYQNCSKMTTAPKIPNGVDNILGMFVGCSKLQVPPTIPDSVTNMQETFNNCTGLTQNPNVPTGVTNLKYAFSNSSITAITIPLTNLTTYDYAISKCPNLTDVTWVGELTNTFNVKNLYYRSATDNTTPTTTDIQELVPEHLGDLYKDKAIFDFSKKEITINNTKTTLE